MVEWLRRVIMKIPESPIDSTRVVSVKKSRRRYPEIRAVAVTPAIVK
jgi:hypothetical protein